MTGSRQLPGTGYHQAVSSHSLISKFSAPFTKEAAYNISHGGEGVELRRKLWGPNIHNILC